MQVIGTEHRDALRQPNHASPSPHSPSPPHVIELEPVISYPLAHVNSHVGLSEAAPPVHEAPAVVVEAVTMMAGQIGVQVGAVGHTPGAGQGRKERGREDGNQREGNVVLGG